MSNFVEELPIASLFVRTFSRDTGKYTIRWENYTIKDYVKAHNDLLLIPFTCSPYIMLGKQEYFCLQGKDYNKGKKRQIY